MARVAYCTKLTSDDERNVVDVVGAVREVRARADARERLEVADEVRLVEVPARRGDVDPRDGPGVRPADDLLKPQHAAEELRREADLARERADKAARAETGGRRDLGDPSRVRRARQLAQ